MSLPSPMQTLRPHLRWLLPLAAGILSLVLTLAFHYRHQLPLLAEVEPAVPQASLSVAVPTPAPVASPAAVPAPPSATPSPTPSPKAPASPAPAKPQPVDPAQYTAEEKALNEQAKRRFKQSIPSVDGMVEMQVAIASGSVVTVGSPDGATLHDESGALLAEMPAKELYTAQMGASGIALGSTELPSVVWLEPSFGGLLQVGDRLYRGSLMLAVHKGEIWAVNYINLREYLHSVVGSEVSPSWPAEALKAQAVAARSYALTYYFRPVSSLYHMGSDEYYQVYSGIGREAPETSAAVDATAGEFVSYRGGIVESLYAASDDIVAEAFEGKGMSQLGALDLAKGGYSYHQILSHYYPTTGVARFEADFE
ncbi:SpoIID/LytB domain-containing protein [Geitlerinema sp. PCC 7407]|uniref:SpoIID/LytB domain-containing protein n=1 Tax=Geitlerinema sp. PCC 7407 TaxID=1173025 RepID=UPI00029F8564|nr:SpoIID/LytB domain-containing protein [Geitlerinema sp. PCC 7407]AFY66588.1 SpoIID/LytB domain protein [Geitlerinema sp. PCC 7407]